MRGRVLPRKTACIILQPLKEELTGSSEQVREASKEVVELQQRLALAVKEEESTCSQLLDSRVEAASSTINTAVLINLSENGAAAEGDSHPPLLPEGDSHPPLLPDGDSLPPLPPSLCALSGSDTILIPEKLTTDSGLHNSTHDHKQDQSHQYLSQELF